MVKSRRTPRRTDGIPAQQVERTLAEVERLAHRHEWAEAQALLGPLVARYPQHPDILIVQLNLAAEMQDYRTYLVACERLLQLDPHEPDLAERLAGAYLMNGYPVLALRQFRRYLTCWPMHAGGEQARTAVARLEGMLPEILAGLGQGQAVGLELATLHEEVQVALNRGDYRGARQTLGALQRLAPDFIPALNNLSLLHWLEGRLEQAIATTQQVLAQDPANIHALSNLVRYLCLSGRRFEAFAWAERLKAAPPQGADPWLKQAEGLSYLGDDTGVLAVVRAASAAGAPGALLYHLGAVAALHLGDEAEARRLWQQALQETPGLAVAQANLADLARPVAERHAPWACEFPNWFSPATLQALMTGMKAGGDTAGSDTALARALRRVLRQHPEIEPTLALLLERGDPPGRELAVRMARLLRSPLLLAALHGFALGQHGPDQLRLEAAQVLTEEGMLGAGPVRFWVQGAWTEVMMVGFEVYYEADEEDVAYPPEVDALVDDALAALHARDGVRAEERLRAALQLLPDAPELANNLALAYELQGRRVEAYALLEQIHAAHPDYFFGRVGLARRHVQEGRLEEARALLDPLLAERRLHASEFRALCQAEMDLQLARQQPEGARAWWEMWAGFEPDHPDLADWQRRIGKGGRQGKGRKR